MGYYTCTIVWPLWKTNLRVGLIVETWLNASGMWFSACLMIRKLWSQSSFTESGHSCMITQYIYYILLHSFWKFIYLGTLDLQLNDMPKGVKTAEKCTLEQLPEPGRSVTTDNLFERKRIKGWWPVYSEEEGGRELAVSFLRELIIIYYSCCRTSLTSVYN